MVMAGVMAAEDGKKPPSMTHRFSTSCALSHRSRTLVPGSVPVTVALHWGEVHVDGEVLDYPDVVADRAKQLLGAPVPLVEGIHPASVAAGGDPAGSIAHHTILVIR